MPLPIDRLYRRLRQTGVARFMYQFGEAYPDSHLKDLVVDDCGPGRLVEINGQSVVNFGSDSFLGLDQHPAILAALHSGIEKWGAHNGTSRAFASVRANVEAEEKIAAWLGTEAALIYPSVTLANAGAIPGLVTKADVIVADEYAHNSIHEANKVAKANGSRVFTFRHNDVADLERALAAAKPYRSALVTIDGVYSMSGRLPPLPAMHAVARDCEAVLYVDDAHGTGVFGDHGRGTVYENLGTYDNTFVAGSLSKALSCFGGFVGCSKGFQELLKIRSNSYIFGGPAPPCYLEAVCAAVDILQSAEYPVLKQRLTENLDCLVSGVEALGLTVLGGLTPIVSVLVGDEGDTLRAGRFLFDRGYYIQSVTFPAVPYRAGVLRIQVNSNHTLAQVNGLLDALGELREVVRLPAPEADVALHQAA